jgi:uncharacterized protein YodC (DUF2158 family)
MWQVFKSGRITCMESTHKIGSLVVLKSGGPVMTVEEVLVLVHEAKCSYRCQWFSGKKLETGVFPEDVLDKSDPTPRVR